MRGLERGALVCVHACMHVPVCEGMCMYDARMFFLFRRAVSVCLENLMCDCVCLSLSMHVSREQALG